MSFLNSPHKKWDVEEANAARVKRVDTCILHGQVVQVRVFGSGGAGMKPRSRCAAAMRDAHAARRWFEATVYQPIVESWSLGFARAT